MTRRFTALIIGALAVLLGACAPGGGGYNANDIVLYGIKERHTIFYGKLEANQTKAVTLGPVNITLSGQQPVGALAVPGALSVNNRPTLRTDTASFREAIAVATIPLSSELSVLTRVPVDRVYYFDGTRWFDVGTGALEANVRVRLPVRERAGLRGVGLLTDAEADALVAYLTDAYKRQPLALALINNANHADSPLGLNPRPDRNNITALYVQTGVPVDLLGGFAPGQEFRLTNLQAGSNSAYGDTAPAVRLDQTAASFAQTWNLISGNQIPVPAAPTVDFSTSSVITFFLGQKSTGGYGVAVAGGIQNGTTLELRLNLRAPQTGAITTQAFTSPFVSVLVTGGGRIERVVAIDAATNAVLARTP
jgi:hypothetical protein